MRAVRNPRGPTSRREHELEAQVEELTSLGESYVEQRAWRKRGRSTRLRDFELIRIEGRISVARFIARLGIPRATSYYRRASESHGQPVRRWPAPVVDRVETAAAETAHRYSAWGHRKI